MGLLFLHWVADQAHACESSIIHTVFLHCEVYCRWRALICNTLAKYASWKQNAAKKKSPALTVSCKRTTVLSIYRSAEKFWTRDSVQDIKKTQKLGVFSFAKACFTLGMTVNSQNNKHWCYKNLTLLIMFLYMTCKSDSAAMWAHAMPSCPCSQRNKYQSLCSINADTILQGINSTRRNPGQSTFFTTL